MLRIKGFIPYIAIIFLNSFIDLGHKILIQNTLYQTENANSFSVYSAIINALMILPYILLFTSSGFIADKYPKRTVLKFTAMLTVPLTVLVTLCYYQGYFYTAFILTLLLAIQSVFNSPAKYGYIKETFGKANIVRVNAFVQSTVILAIIISSLAFSIIFDHYLFASKLQDTTNRSLILKSFAPAGYLLIVFSLLEVICTFVIPEKPAADSMGKYSISSSLRLVYLKSYLKEACKSRPIVFCILGLSLLWGINQVLIAGFGAYLKTFAGNPSPVFVQGLFGVGALGLLFGATYISRRTQRYIEMGMISFSALGMTTCLLILSIAVDHFIIFATFLVYGIFCGMLIVPLNSLIQVNAINKDLGKVMATSNFVQTVFMIFFLLVNILFISAGLNIRHFLLLLFILSFAASIYTFMRYPLDSMRLLAKFVLKRFYCVQVSGHDHIPTTGAVLMLGNHVSYVDALLLQIASHRKIHFVMERSIYQRWYLNWFLRVCGVIPISRRGSQEALKSIRNALENGKVVLIFPEGRLSRNGQIGAFRPGYEKAISGISTVIVPFYLRGLWGSISSHATSRYRRISRIKRRHIGVTFGEPMSSTVHVAEIKHRVMQLSVISWMNYASTLGTISEEWLRRVKQFPTEKSVFDSTGKELTGTDLLSTVMLTQRHIKSIIRGQNNVGIILPPGVGGVVANLTVMSLGKTVVNLNYTAGTAAIKSALVQSKIKVVITSDQFIKKLSSKGYNLTEILHECRVFNIEQIKRRFWKVIFTKNYILARILPYSLLKLIALKKSNNSDVAAILFSSGSEGVPKGVKLTHINIISNVKQISTVASLQHDDVVVSSLPLFHAFGLTVTTILPLIEAIPLVCHADPSDVSKIAKLIYEQKASIVLGTPTLFNLFCRNKRVFPQMLKSIRIAISGAEKLNSNVLVNFKQKFNLDIYEGYGVTEVSPVASCNLPDILDSSDWHMQSYNRVGSVGMPLPGTAFRIADPDTMVELDIGQAGMVMISGPQVMQGYLDNAKKNNEVLIANNNLMWYITGDKGYLDDDGFLTIIDRYSRFAKIAGEMISLTAIERDINAVINSEDIEIAVVAVSDDRKGEKIILIHTSELHISSLREKLITSGLNRLALPAHTLQVDSLPMLGTGKKDYRLMQSQVIDKFEN